MDANNSANNNLPKSSVKIRTMKNDIEELSKKGQPVLSAPAANATPIPKPSAPEIKIPQKPEETDKKISSKPSILAEIEKLEQAKAKKISTPEIPLSKLPIEKPAKTILQAEQKKSEMPNLKPLKAMPTFAAPAEKPIIPPELPFKIKKILKISLIIVPIVAAVGIGIGFIVYYFSAPPAFSEPKTPPALFVVDKIKIINLNSEDPILFEEKIKEVASKKEDAGIFSQLLVKKSETICVKFKKNCSNKYSYLSVADIYKLLRITPANFLKKLDNNHATIFTYQEGDEIKFGIVAEPEDIDSAQNELLTIENNLYEYLPLFIRPIESTPLFTSFQEASYQNIQVRYNNYPSPDQAIDYAFYTPNAYILMTNSKNSMTAVINRLKETSSQ